MTDTPLIRRVVTADRGVRAVTTREVLDCIKEMPGKTFSTRDVAEAVRAKYAKCSNIDFFRLEYSVRQAIVWLCRRGEVSATKVTIKRFTAAREPYWVTVYLRIEKGEPVDVRLLNQIFLHVVI